MKLSRLALALLLAAPLGACSGDPGGVYEIETVRYLDEPQADTGPIPDGVRFMWQKPAGQKSSGGLAWTTPEGWTEKPATSMRLGSFMVEDRPGLDCSITQLPSDGGGLTANVNRWYGQMGLEPLTATEVEQLPKLKLLGRDATLVDITGSYSGMSGGEGTPDMRMLGLVLTLPQVSLFVKLVGPEADVAAEYEAFQALCDSIRMGAPTAAPTDTSSAPASSDTPEPTGDGGPVSWTKPDSWTRQEGSRAMRLVTFHPGGREDTECYLSVAGGDVVSNINRWRGQFGASELDQQGVMDLPRMTVLGESVPLVEARGPYQGMAGQAADDAALLGTMAPLPGSRQMVFVKLIGPADVVAAERENFIRFCESLRP